MYSMSRNQWDDFHNLVIFWGPSLGLVVRSVVLGWGLPVSRLIFKIKGSRDREGKQVPFFNFNSKSKGRFN